MSDKEAKKEVLHAIDARGGWVSFVAKENSEYFDEKEGDSLRDMVRFSDAELERIVQQLKVGGFVEEKPHQIIRKHEDGKSRHWPGVEITERGMDLIMN